MLLHRLSSIRGQLVAWYLGILAVLLLALGIFQSITLRDYLRSSAAHSLRTEAYGELSLLGPCYVQSSSRLAANAQTLARLLGSPDTAVMIVTRTGQTLASHSSGLPGSQGQLHLSGAAVHQLITGSGTTRTAIPPGIALAACPRPGSRPAHAPTGHLRDHHVSAWTQSLISGSNLLVIAIPLGSQGVTFGYAILGRSLNTANAIAGRVLLVFGLGALSALILATLVTIPIINRALRPLRRVTEAAEAIASGDRSRRARVGRVHDEVGRLGLAFDTMVDRLQAALSRTAASEERMRRFLADASHELRTPVTVLRGASQVLLRRQYDDDPELRESLRDVHEEAVRLSRLVDDLLTLSRIDSGQELMPQSVEVRSFLHDFLERYGKLWQSRHIELRDATLNGATVRADPEALRRVLTNLIENAARYSRSGGAITVTGAELGDRVSLSIADEGPGMTAEDAAHVFERFYRANKSRSRNSGGTGLGLAIVRGLVETSGGAIELDTGPNRGTTVTVTLPREAHDAGNV